jgi:hypothetical protein
MSPVPWPCCSPNIGANISVDGRPAGCASDARQIPSSISIKRNDSMRVLIALLILLAGLVPMAAWADPTFKVSYEIAIEENEPWADIAIKVDSGRVLKQLDFSIDPARHKDFRADGGVETRAERVVWEIPRKGGTLRLRALIPHERRGDGYDAILAEDFALFRGDDMIPPATARALKGARSDAVLRFRLPSGWSVQTGWIRQPDRVSFRIENDERTLARPIGWMIAGRIGVRVDRPGNVELMVAGPEGSGLRRMDVLTFMNFVWPEFEGAFGNVPPKILLVGAGDPMWRGGLSAPNSIFLHADRPIVSENGTSTLVHELFHVVTRIRGAKDDDWIAEGLAEYYAVELLRRAGGVSDVRHAQIREWFEDFGKDVRSLKGPRARGERMSRAAILFWDLDQELREVTDGAKNLDDVVRELIPLREVSEAELRRVATRVAGQAPETLDTPLLR